jgi:hypothetical protein
MRNVLIRHATLTYVRKYNISEVKCARRYKQKQKKEKVENISEGFSYDLFYDF